MSKYPGRIVTDLAPAGYSVFFDGTSDYLITGNSGSATGNFTVELWTYQQVPTNTWYPYVFGSNTPWVGTGGVGMAYDTQTTVTNATTVYVTIAGAGITLGTFADIRDRWVHVAIVRNGSTITAYLNGVVRGSVTNSSTVNISTWLIGGVDEGGAYDNHASRGYISNFRYVRGTAVYTSAFTPPTQLFNITNTSLLTCNSPALVDQSSSPLTITANGNAAVSTFTPFTAYVPYNPALGASTPGIWTLDEALQAAGTRQWNMYDPAFNLTTLLLHGNPTNGTSFITDASTNNFTVTPNGDVRAANLSPFSLTTFATSGSAYFDGTGDFVNLGGQSAFSFGTGDWTVEFWMNFTATGGTLFDTRPAGTASTNGFSVLFLSAGSVRYDTASGVKITGSTLSANTWYHVALSKASGVTRLFINGVQDGSSYTDSVNYGVGANRPIIGADGNSPTSVLFTGYLSNYRIVKGVGVYTGNFTTPTAPLTATQAAGTNISAITGTQTSLLTLQSSQSSNNNAFLDSSSNNFLITRNGNTTQGSFSPFSQTGWSNYIGGSANFLNLTTATIGTNSFTIEAWVYLNSNSNFSGIFSLLPNASGTGVSLVFQNTGVLSGMVGNGGSALVISSPTAVTVSTWHHVAFVRSGTALTLYLNGVSVATGTSSANITQTSALIGRYYNDFNDYYLNGYISNLRVVNGAAVYAANFTPPTAPLTAITNTMLLTCQSNRFVDNSSNAYTISTSGTPSVQPFGPFYPTAAYTPQTIGGSGYFDGSSDNLTAAGNAAFAFGTGDFTLEAWINPTTISTGTFDRVCATSDFNGSGFDWTMNTGSSSLFLAGSSYGFAINTRSWNHIVYTRSGTTLRGFLNGRLASYNTGVSQNISSTTSLLIGQGYSGTNFNGYMTDLRIIKGSIPTAYQTSATTTGTQVFTAPTAPLTTTSQGATSGNVSLLLNYTNAGVVDSTGDNVFETVGNVQISTTRSRFGGSSIFFDGTGDGLYIPAPQKENLRFGTGDFTIEFWAWKSADGSTSYDAVIGVGSTGNYFGGFVVELSATRGFCFIYDGAVRISSNFNPNDSTWHHYAVVRSANTFALYRDGVQLAIGTLTPTLGVTGEAWIGAGVTSGGNNFNGYIDELRVTKGFARYTGPFTPQTSQWQDQ